MFIASFEMGFNQTLLNIVIFLPLIASLLILIMKKSYIKLYSLLVAIIELLIIIYLWYALENSASFQFGTSLEIGYGLNYSIAVDAISLSLILLSSILVLCSIIYLRNVPNQNYLFIALLSLETIVIGLFASTNALLFYTFWELSLIPTMCIIGNWGGERRFYASMKFVMYTVIMSLIMLFGILSLGYVHSLATGSLSFELLDWYNLNLDPKIQNALFILFLIGIAVKIPLFPLHTWLPITYTQAPTVGSVLLSGILSKMGTYALIRFLIPLFPDSIHHFSILIASICVVMIIYSASIAFVQKDIKQVIAYSSLAHMGVIVLGIFSMNVEGISGAVFFMFAHGIISAALFILIGSLIERVGTSNINEFGGLSSNIPKITIVFSIILMAAISLPLTIGFVGEFLSLLGFFKVNIPITIIAAFSIVVVAIYMLNLFRRIFLGEPKINKSLIDIQRNEFISLLPLAILVIWLGIQPNTLLNKIQSNTRDMLTFIDMKNSTNESFSILQFLDSSLENEGINND